MKKLKKYFNKEYTKESINTIKKFIKTNFNVTRINFDEKDKKIVATIKASKNDRHKYFTLETLGGVFIRTVYLSHKDDLVYVGDIELLSAANKNKSKSIIFDFIGDNDDLLIENYKKSYKEFLQNNLENGQILDVKLEDDLFKATIEKEGKKMNVFVGGQLEEGYLMVGNYDNIVPYNELNSVL